MGAQIREYRQRIRSVSSIKKITRAMELMAASRVVKARQRVVATTPYAEAIQRALSEWREQLQRRAHPHPRGRGAGARGDAGRHQ